MEGVEDDTIFVAVGKDVKEGKSLLDWTIQSFGEKKICLLHVHKLEEHELDKLEEEAIKTVWKPGMQRMIELINEYLGHLLEEGVEADNVWIEMDSIERGIVQLVGSTISDGLSWGLHQKDMIQRAAKSSSPENQNLYPDKGHHHAIFGFLGRDASFTLGRGIFSCRGTQATKALKLSQFQEELSHGQQTDEVHDKLQQARVDAQNLKREAFEESVQHWRAEEDIMEAICKAKSFKSLCSKELRRRKELEAMLAREKEEVEKMRNLYDKSLKELHILQERMPLLETRLAESNCDVKELEAKIISAADLLVSFKDQRDRMRAEHKNTVREVEELKEAVNNSFCASENFTITFSEITEATQDFDPAWKIGDGGNGSVYYGLLHHLRIAIKMLPSHGSQGSLEFQSKVHAYLETDLFSSHAFPSS